MREQRVNQANPSPDGSHASADNPNSLTRRRLLSAASLTAAGVAAATVAANAQQGFPAVPKPAGNPRPAENSQRGATQGAAGHHGHEPLGGFEVDIEKAEPRVAPGGTAKEANVEQFPISESMAGVSMRLKPGGLRGLHWDAVAAEWAYVLKGNGGATLCAPSGQ